MQQITLVVEWGISRFLRHVLEKSEMIKIDKNYSLSGKVRMKLASKACCNPVLEAVEARVKFQVYSVPSLNEVELENVDNKINSQGSI